MHTQLRGQHRVDGVGRLKFDSTQARVMMLELKAIFPCIRAIGLNAAWHCEIGGLACANRREDILDAAKFFGVDGINEHATRVQKCPPKSPRGGG